ncbi:helix-turn-helix domain-containing protein [Alicyclobacillus macrosporangiidus]|uniref:helix-turn-helix domain-containing protein n=1 Tax=Alicyclobacillus macrosporangiidus TaxID=392015 RepID=UPI0034E96FFA
MNRIRELRTLAGMSQEELARAAQVSQPFLSQIETEARQPSLRVLKRIAEVLGVSVSELLSDSPTE